MVNYEEMIRLTGDLNLSLDDRNVFFLTIKVMILNIVNRKAR